MFARDNFGYHQRSRSRISQFIKKPAAICPYNNIATAIINNEEIIENK